MNVQLKQLSCLDSCLQLFDYLAQPPPLTKKTKNKKQAIKQNKNKKTTNKMDVSKFEKLILKLKLKLVH